VFLTYLSPVLLPQLWPGAIVVMDNLKVHHATAVRAAIEAVGARLVFLPPYSPDLSPIELCWSKVKQFLRSQTAPTYEALHQAITQAVNAITEDDALWLVRSLWPIHLKNAVISRFWLKGCWASIVWMQDGEVFLNIMGWVATKRGVYFAKVDSRGTSQLCPICDSVCPRS
jgi:transposase